MTTIQTTLTKNMEEPTISDKKELVKNRPCDKAMEAARNTIVPWRTLIDAFFDSQENWTMKNFFNANVLKIPPPDDIGQTLDLLSACETDTEYYASLLEKIEELVNSEENILELLESPQNYYANNWIRFNSILQYFYRKKRFSPKNEFASNALSASIRALANKNPNIRNGAYKFLIKLGPYAKTAMPELKRLFAGDELDFSNRFLLMHTLGAIQTEEAFSMLKEAMENRDESHEVRHGAIFKLSDEFLPNFLEILKTEKNILIFESIIKRLWEILDKKPEVFNDKIQDTLLEIFEKEQEYFIRKNIIKFILELLKKYGNKSSLENLIVRYEKISKKMIRTDSESKERELLANAIYNIRRRVKASLPENHKNFEGCLSIAQTGNLEGATSLTPNNQKGNLSISEDNQEGNIFLFEAKEK